jgi:lipopolysaccharide biosynthesis protein
MNCIAAPPDRERESQPMTARNSCSPSRRAIVMAHFDARGGFAPYVHHALATYREIAQRLVVVSNSARALPASLATIVDTFIPRANVGYDFGAWRDGLATLPQGTFDEVLCVNDSVYGPLADITPALGDPRVANADLWGMVLSDQNASREAPRLPHVQSWFFGLRRPLLESDAFAAFWRDFEPLGTKRTVVERYEIGFSARMAAAGFRLAGLYDATTAPCVTLREVWPHVSLASPRRSWRLIRKSRRRPHNPSELVWWRLWDAGVPYVKASLFRVNHYGLDLGRVLCELRQRFHDDLGLGEHHLRACG